MKLQKFQKGILNFENSKVSEFKSAKTEMKVTLESLKIFTSTQPQVKDKKVIS